MSRYALAGTGGTPWPVLKPLSQTFSRSIRIGRTACILGDHARVHVPLHSPMVSRTHALIVIDGVETYVRDLASRNGLYLNGHVVREGRLRHGDLLCIGPYAFWWTHVPPAGPRPRQLFSGGPPTFAELQFDHPSHGPHRIENHTFLIGRRDGCDLVIDQAMVEPAHAVIYRRWGGFVLRDLNSSSGTFVNNRRTREIDLRRGDDIRVGLTRMRFEPPARPAAGASAEEALTGLSAVGNADHGGALGTAGACPTIEQLLGGSTTPITQWERPLRKGLVGASGEASRGAE